MHLSRDAFDRAAAFMDTHARPLDSALLTHELSGGNADAVIEQVARYQNGDGGFGHGIEPDLRTPASTAIATTTGLRALRAVGAPVASPVVAGAIRYLVESVDSGVWPIITREVDLAPHAPWWSWSDTLAESWNGFRFNPSAEAVAFLWEYRELVPDELLQEVTDTLQQGLERTELLDSYYDLHCCVSLRRTRGLPAELTSRLEEVIRSSLEALDPADEHTNYFELCPRPDPFLLPIIRDRLMTSADAAIASQSDEGCWKPFWDWSFVDADEWAKAEVEWQGVLTRTTLTALVHHGLVD